MILHPKRILTEGDLRCWRQELARGTAQVIATNGVFDILHAGHVEFFRVCKTVAMGPLIVGVNSDDSVRKLKGPKRPINGEEDRISVLCELTSVDYVYLFQGTRACHFLAMAQPHVWCKAGYTMETLDAGEVDMVRSRGGKIQLFPNLVDISTTRIIERIKHDG